MRVAIAREVVDYNLKDAPTLEGTAPSSGRIRTIRPVRLAVRRYSSGQVDVVAVGPSVKPDGSETSTQFEVRCRVAGDSRMYAKAPPWVVELADAPPVAPS